MKKHNPYLEDIEQLHVWIKANEDHPKFDMVILELEGMQMWLLSMHKDDRCCGTVDNIVDSIFQELESKSNDDLPSRNVVTNQIMHDLKNADNHKKFGDIWYCGHNSLILEKVRMAIDHCKMITT